LGAILDNLVLDSSWLTVIALAALGFGILLAGVITIFMYHIRQRNAHYRRTIDELQNTIRALTMGAVGIGERMVDIEKHLRRLAERQDELDLRQSAHPYGQAIKKAHEGTDVNELISAYGMSRGEAELIVNLHRSNGAAVS